MNRRRSDRLIEKMGKKKSPKKVGKGGKRATILDYLNLREEEEGDVEGAASEQGGGDGEFPPPQSGQRAAGQKGEVEVEPPPMAAPATEVGGGGVTPHSGSRGHRGQLSEPIHTAPAAARGGAANNNTEYIRDREAVRAEKGD